MRRTPILAAVWIAFALSAMSTALLSLAPAKVSAQDDLRGILPYIMLVVDTSGSMERLPTCTCTTPSCIECLPDCNSTDLDEKMNRWGLTLSALTGTFTNFQCTPLARNITNGMSYDLGYYLPYHQPWDCTSPSGPVCAYNSPNSTLTQQPQQSNGILDLNVSGVRFGLMTFDGWDTYTGAPPLVPSSEFDEDLSNAVQGLWSYGDPSPTSKVGRFHYPNCTTEYRMDTGARSAIATEGSLISLESCTGNGPPGSTPECPGWCTVCPATQATINRDIQEALLSARPYGGTPIAASLDDLYYHLSDDLSDEFQGCRDRYALLITDGYPDDDYRSYGCNCKNEGDPMDPNRCGPPPNNPDDMQCPYPTAEEVAADLVEGRGSDGAMVERVYVVGLAIDDASVVARLNAIADSGCTGTAAECENGDMNGDMVNDQALFATSPSTLTQSVQRIVEASNRPVSRTVPVFALSDDPVTPQYQFTTALRLPTEEGEPWTGILERRRWDCGKLPLPGFANLSSAEGDLFHDDLNTQPTARQLLTSFPTTGTPNLEGTINKALTSCGVTGCSLFPIQNSSIVTDAVLGTTPSVRQQTISWMYGDAGTPREDAKMGAIYHSSPVIVGSPQFDTADASYNAFRRNPLISDRPQILYIGTNDGILHAISTESFSRPASSPMSWRNLIDGEELWGFVPPMLLNDLKTNLDTHQLLMDGTPVVKNVNINTSLGAAGYKTILVTGMRQGGSAYMAMDVTDPFDPKFLWQVSSPFPSPHPNNLLGQTFGKAAIVQARFRRPPPGGGANVTKDGAIAILPGGVGLPVASQPGCNGSSNESMRNGTARFDTISPQQDGTLPVLQHRADVRCWSLTGRSLLFVDVEDGYIVKTIHLTNPSQAASSSNEPIFPAPLVSTPAAFPDEVGSVATRAFITDADGVIWRIDLRGEFGSDPVPDDPMRGWTARPFHDIFWDLLPGDGEVTYEAPMLSKDAQGRPVVMVGTGDTSDFVKINVRNRIVSLTEVETASAVDSALHYKASMNWEMRTKTGTVTTTMTDGTAITVDGLATSELVSGPMGLFEGQLYAGTFIAVTNSTEVCDLGRGRIHALDYTQRDFLDSNGTTPRTYGPFRVNAGTTAASNIVNIRQDNAAGDNIMILGLTVTQRPSCAEADSTYTDPWGQTWSGVDTLAPPELYLVAHADFDRGGSSLVDQRGGSDVFGVEIKLTPPIRVSTISSWATSVD